MGASGQARPVLPCRPGNSLVAQGEVSSSRNGRTRQVFFTAAHLFLPGGAIFLSRPVTGRNRPGYFMTFFLQYKKMRSHGRAANRRGQARRHHPRHEQDPLPCRRGPGRTSRTDGGRQARGSAGILAAREKAKRGTFHGCPIKKSKGGGPHEPPPQKSSLISRLPDGHGKRASCPRCAPVTIRPPGKALSRSPARSLKAAPTCPAPARPAGRGRSPRH